MRYTFIVLAGFAVGLTSVNAATSVSGTNLTGNPVAGFTGVPITDNVGAPIAFSYAAGTFTSVPDFLAPSLDLSGFSSFSTSDESGTGNPAAPGLFGAPYAISAVQNTGSNAFVLIGNGATFGASTDYIVLDLGLTAKDEVVGNGSLSFSLLSNTAGNHTGDSGTLTIERGVPTIVQGYAAPFDSLNGQSGLTFGPIPEPSTSLLAGLAGLTILIRRKR